MTIRVLLPAHLQTLARCEREIALDVPGAVTLRAVLDALETRYPMLCGTVREHETGRRRPKVRFFADGADVSLRPPDESLPPAVQSGREPLMIIAAIAGG